MRLQKIRKPIVITTAFLFHSLLIFHLLFSPVIIILASNQGIINASFFSFVIIFLLCGNCIDACKSEALFYSISTPSRRRD